MIDVCKVCIPNTHHAGFDYSSGGFEPIIGARVLVSFRKSTKIGVVIAKEVIQNSERVLKEILEVIDTTPVITTPILTLCHWISSYYQAPLSEVIALALPKKIRQGRPLDIGSATRAIPEVVRQPLELNAEQAHAVAAITASMDKYHTFLLQGITGSGKTEVYLQCIAKVLNAGRQVLVLVPEIGLTPQLEQRFRERFAVPMAVIHSNLSETARAKAWLLAKDNIIKLIIGTRTALFTPMPALSLIIIDEEHDASLKQMEGVRYFARDTALMRAYLANIPVVLGTATPSLESLHNCSLQKYSKLLLTSKALQSAPIHYELLDLRNQTLEEGLAEPTLKKIGEHLSANKQVLVFINRRGFAPILLCHSCGAMTDCSACDSHMTLHNQQKKLVCHHCGHIKQIPSICKSCQGKTLVPVGAGTERIYEVLQKKFPSISMQKTDRDEVRKKGQLTQHLNRILEEEVQLIVGTQMLAKGHHFPKVSLVVVVNADTGFYNQDFRALEQLGQLLTQMAGRAGRAELAGEVLIQTHLPHHPLLNILIQQGYAAFAEALLKAREEANLPPYAYLALIRAEDKKANKINELLQSIKAFLGNYALNVLGPAPAPLARKANHHRMQLLVKAKARKTLQGALQALSLWMETNKDARGIRWSVDVDPQDLS